MDEHERSVRDDAAAAYREVFEKQSRLSARRAAIPPRGSDGRFVARGESPWRSALRRIAVFVEKVVVAVASAIMLRHIGL